MQYIQLQGQVAETLDSPINGAFNLFVDTSDNTIKIKDGDGNITSGGGLSLIDTTYFELTSSIASGSLTAGAFYKITGAATSSIDSWVTFQEGGSTIILQAATTSSISKRGIGLFWNPNYASASVWDDTFVLQMATNTYGTDVYFNMEEVIMCDAPSSVQLKPNVIDTAAIVTISDVQAASFFTDLENYPIAFESQNTGITGSFTGVFLSASYAVGDKVIWGGRVWQNRSGSIGGTVNETNLNSEDWVKVPYQSGLYTLVADEIEYDIENNHIQYRKDIKHNVEVTQTYEGDEGRLIEFPWGHPNIYNVSLENTSINNFVNFHNTNTISGLYMKHGSRFEANYWGMDNNFSDIYGDVDSDIQNISLGHGCDIRRLRLGINTTLGSGGTIFITGNDGSDAFYDITFDNNARIYDIEMYQYSTMHDLSIGINSEIYGINLYNDADVYDCNLEMNTSINSISMGRDSVINNIELQPDSYIANFNMDFNSSLSNIRLGGGSYLEYMNLGRYCSISEIDMGLDSSAYCNSLYEVNDVGSSINAISMGSNSNFNNINLYPDTYISNINGSINTSFGQITITGSNSYISNFEIEQNGGFGGFTLDGTSEPVIFNTFKIGQDAGFGGLGNVITTNTNVTIEKGFNNFQANEFTLGITGSLYWEDIASMPQLDANKTFYILDTTGWDASTDDLNYYLPNGGYDGQTIKFFLTGYGANMTDTNIGRLKIWCTMGLPSDVTGAGGNYPWYPFNKYDYGTSQYRLRTDTPTAIWLNNKWIIDNNNWD